MHLHPSWVVFLAFRFRETNCLKPSLLVNLLVAPNAIRPHISAVQIRLSRVKNHAVDGGLVAVFIVLNIRLERTIIVYAEDIAEAGIVVERITVDVVWRFSTRK